MKQKLNNALNELDERLIQEAAQAERLESNAPKILKRVLIPTGAVAAAGLCAFALTDRLYGGVILTASASEASIPAAVIPANDENDTGDILPEVMELHAPSREYAEEVIFGSEFPTLIYADDNRIVFTDWRSIYLYYRNEGRITYSANVYEALKEYAGDRLCEFGDPVWYAFAAAVNGDALLITASFYHQPTGAYYNYKIDLETGLMRQYDTLDAGYSVYHQQRSADFGGGDVTDVLIVSDSEYVGVAVGQDDFTLRGVELREYAVSDGRIEVTNTAKPFDDEYFDSLEMENKYLGVYQSGDSVIRFDTRAMTFEWVTLPEMNSLRSGSYSISNDAVTLKDDINGESYVFLMTDGALVAADPDSIDIPEDSLGSGNFVKWYGRDITAAEDAGIQPQPSEEAGNEQKEQIIVEYSDILKAEEEISKSILRYQSEHGISYDSEAAAQLINDMIYPLDGSFHTVTTYNGYDEWRGGTHYGIDIGDEGIAGAKIYAPLDGTVIEAASEGWNGGMGNYIIIDHGSGVSTVYAHCGEVNVTEGQRVSQGEVIGTVGRSGWSSGYILHFEIRENGEVLSESMDRFVGNFRLGEINSNSDIIQQNYTKSIYDPTTAPQVIDSLTCPVAEAFNQYSETPGSYYGHSGIDFCATGIYGQEIYAAQSGEVVLAEWYYGYGYCVMIDHGSGVLTVYGHCSELDVSAGQTVEQGEVIGRVGRTGQSTGDVLHFEIRVEDTPDFDAMYGFMERIGAVRSPLAGDPVE